LLRVVSGAVLAPLGAWAVYAGGLGLALATGACAVLAALEWTRMASQTESRWSRWLLYLVAGATAAGAVYVAPQGIEQVALVALIGCALAAGLAWISKGSVSSMAFGIIYTSLHVRVHRRGSDEREATAAQIFAQCPRTRCLRYFGDRSVRHAPRAFARRRFEIPEVGRQ
jgi:hypothetical protein